MWKNVRRDPRRPAGVASPFCDTPATSPCRIPVRDLVVERRGGRCCGLHAWHQVGTSRETVREKHAVRMPLLIHNQRGLDARPEVSLIYLFLQFQHLEHCWSNGCPRTKRTPSSSKRSTKWRDEYRRKRRVRLVF